MEMMIKRLLLLIAILLAPVAASAQTAAIVGFCQLGATPAKTQGANSTNNLQGLVPSCTVTVYLTGTVTKATIFADSISTPLANPFTATTKAQWTFFAAINQGYDVVLSGGTPPNNYTTPVTLTALYPAQQIIGVVGPPGPQGPPGVSGTPAGPAFAVNFANSGVTAFQADQAINVDPVAHAFTAQINNGVSNAASFQTGGGNNGITNAAATGAVVVADPTYSAAEQYSLSGISPAVNFWVPTSFHFKNLRSGYQTDFFHDWNPSGNNFGDGHNPAEQHVFLIDNIVSGNTVSIVHQNGMDMQLWSSTPGWNVGNPAVCGTCGWWAMNSLEITGTIFTSGITQGLTQTYTKFGVGDNTGGYTYVHGRGGAVGASDEGTKAWPTQTIEDTSVRQSTCSTGCTSGSTSFKMAASGAFGSGMYAYDSTAGATYTGNVTSIVAGLGVASAVTVNTTVPVSNAWGTLASNVATPINPNPAQNFATSETFNVTIVNGTFDTTHLACFVSQFHECAIPSAVGAVSGGIQSVTVSLRRPHAINSYVFQGGLAGFGLEMIAFTSTGQKYFLDVVGSTSTAPNIIQVVGWKAGSAQSTPIAGIFGHTLYDVGNVTAITNGGSGTTVTVTYTTSGSTLFGATTYSKNPFYLQGFSDTAFNTICTNVVWSSTTSFTCTIAGLSAGAHSATTGTFQLANASVPINAMNLWPIAEVTDSQNEATVPPTVDGTVTMEPNVVPLAVNHVVVESNQTAGIWRGDSTVTSINNPYSLYNGHILITSGNGIVGGGNGVTSSVFDMTQNQNADTFYHGVGGFQSPPTWQAISGAYYNGFLTDHGPDSGACGFICIAPNTTQKTNVNYSYDL